MTDARDLDGTYFDDLYARTPDPWRLDVGFYEQRKRDLLLASLPRPRFGRCFEPGCALGLLTYELAARCDHVLAVDVAPAAVASTRARVRDLPHVEVRRAAVPDDWPDGAFDLVVVSEVGYYLADPGRLADRVRGGLAPGGVVVACHWRQPTDYPSTAQDVHAALGHDLHSVCSHVEDDFLLDVWSREGRSVADLEGVLP